ncbi:MAG TPA: hypothetical protein H9991_11110, partial [Candidatus Mailhella excrementigallinarum]|nr:hypothetical protein [Candidatus Mailhella excrementigallinarum]
IRFLLNFDDKFSYYILNIAHHCKVIYPFSGWKILICPFPACFPCTKKGEQYLISRLSVPRRLRGTAQLLKTCRPRGTGRLPGSG